MDRIRRAIDKASSKTAHVAHRASTSLTSSSSDIAAIFTSSVRSSYLLDDKIVLDIGSLYSKIGFAGEPAPRFILPNNRSLFRFWNSGFSDPALLDQLELDLADHLSDLFFFYLLTNPLDKSLIITEPVFMPLLFKQCLIKILFSKFKIAALIFIPSELAVVLTSGQGTGLVVECGHLDSTVTPVYDYQVLDTNTLSLPLAGATILAHLKDLLVKFGSLVTPVNDNRQYSTSQDQPTHSGNPLSPSLTDRLVNLASVSSYWSNWSNWALDLPSRNDLPTSPDTIAIVSGVGHGHTLVPWTDYIAEKLLTHDFLEELKTRLLFIGRRAHDNECVTVSEPADLHSVTPTGGSPARTSHEVNPDLTVPNIPTTDQTTPRLHGDKGMYLIRQYRIYKSAASTVYLPLGERGLPILSHRHMKLIVPGWIRERAAEPLFEGDADQRSIGSLILDGLLGCSRDVRAAVAMNIVISGGTVLLPGFLDRLYDEIMHLLATNSKYSLLHGLKSLIQLTPPGYGQFHYGPWVGASLAASLKILDDSALLTRDSYESQMLPSDPS